MTDSNETTAKRELRLALVMNGGVSLAVWMGGVTTEIDNLRRCRPDAGDSTPVLTAWSAILAKSEYDRVIVDTIAGTSAGGLNGVLLGTAIARGAPFPALASLWREQAALRRGALLPDPHGAVSVLDGEYFERQIRAKLADISPDPNLPLPADVTLLVTATSLTPCISQRDTPSGEVRWGDRRRVYRFQRRANAVPPEVAALSPNVDPVDDFTASANARLALAGRASAGFPGAFAPVPSTQELADAESHRRGKVLEYLADGGVLDNAPFEPMLDALRDRPADAPFTRVLLYVKP